MTEQIGLYRVVGKRLYRGHEPGTEFAARIAPRAEQRAIARGDLELVDRCTPELPEVWKLPVGWTESPNAGEKRAGRRLSTLEERRS